jgi:hypothetical protein
MAFPSLYADDIAELLRRIFSAPEREGKGCGAAEGGL